jgi:hypothetical protein
MDDVNNDIHERFQAFGIVVVWNDDSIKLCKHSFIHNNLNKLKNSVLSYRANLQQMQKIWIEFDQPSLELR